MTKFVPRPAARVSNVELFFDLVFVFAVTQLTSLVRHEPGFPGLFQAVVVLGLLWWMYDGYVWLANAVRPDSTPTKLGLFAAMAAFLVLALAIPHAFNSAGLVFAVAYLVVVVLYTLLFMTAGVPQVVRATLAVLPYNLAAAALVLLPGLIPALPHWPFWLAGVGVLVFHTLTARLGRIQIQSAHYVERHGLLIIIALGESVIAVGVGASAVPVSPALVIAVVLGLAVGIGMWFTYFDGADERAVEALDRATAQRRSGLAVQMAYTHYAMIFGIILLASGLQEVVTHLAEPGHAAIPWLLAAGVALFLLGNGEFRRSLRIGGPVQRLVAAAVALASAFVGLAANEAVQLLVLVLALATVPVLAARRRGVGSVR
ncbi:low temperature requirement protein A [Specibacter cremeus]|uniref:low temperature requirement protein A n=1 Tax=Specibacter cremeus TaxID=1629051 RepID=UPI000F777774|nr:low temperature requirement protein A [Specibacter cremeus]